MSNRKELLLKSEGVKDCVKWIEKQIKEEKKLAPEYDDYGIHTEKINTMVNIKISLEKYMKKLKHEADE